MLVVTVLCDCIAYAKFFKMCAIALCALHQTSDLTLWMPYVNSVITDSLLLPGVSSEAAYTPHLIRHVSPSLSLVLLRSLHPWTVHPLSIREFHMPMHRQLVSQFLQHYFVFVSTPTYHHCPSWCQVWNRHPRHLQSQRQCYSRPLLQRLLFNHQPSTGPE